MNAGERDKRQVVKRLKILGFVNCRKQLNKIGRGNGYVLKEGENILTKSLRFMMCEGCYEGGDVKFLCTDRKIRESSI